jgi:hypothetical protein
MAAAASLEPAQRDKFVQAVVDELATCPLLGPGIVHH